MTQTRKKKWVYGVILSILAILLFIGCNNVNQEKSKLMIGFSVYEDDSVRSVAMIKSVLDEAQNNDMTIELKSADQSLKKQREDISYLIKQQPQYLVVIPLQSIGLGEVLKKAYENGIKVILLDQIVNDIENNEYLTQITTDPKWEGKVCAQLLGAYFNRRDAKILVVQGKKGASSANDRDLGFREELCNFPNLEIVGVVDGDFNRLTAQQNVGKFIEKGGKFDAIFAHSDEDGLGALAALSIVMEDVSKIPIVSVNGQQDVKKALIAGEYFACIEATPEFGSYVIDIIKKDIAGIDIDHEIVVRGKVITQKNVTEMKGY